MKKGARDRCLKVLRHYLANTHLQMGVSSPRWRPT